MDTPICDFVAEYRKKGGVRLHMPGHKGRSFLGVEALDITEIRGADELYRARGIIRQSEENAAALFGAGRTVYSTEGSSLCIRAMVYLALLWGRENGRRPLILAGRNAHRAFISACALMDAEVEWLIPEREASLISCRITAPELETRLRGMQEKPAAVYVTSPDYLGHVTDVGALSAVCRRHGVLLLVDNAHGAYLKFLRTDRHPISMGADLCCDSAHKTLPALTGGAYLHLGKGAPDTLSDSAEKAMALFASTSPSYLILQSLDRCNAYLSDGYMEKLAALCGDTSALKSRLLARGYDLAGDEPCKITLAPKGYGYTGDALHEYLRARNMECEFSDPDFLTAMVTPETGAQALERWGEALLAVPRKEPVDGAPPPAPKTERALSIREALLAPSREIPVEDAGGRILADAQTACPPCIPILISGEIITREAIRCFRYYGIESCRIVTEGEK